MKMFKALLMAVLPWVVGCASVQTESDQGGNRAIVPVSVQSIEATLGQSSTPAPTRQWTFMISEIKGDGTEVLVFLPNGNEGEVKVGARIPFGSEIITGNEEGLVLEVMHGSLPEHAGLRLSIRSGSIVLLDSIKAQSLSDREAWTCHVAVASGECSSTTYLDRSDFCLSCLITRPSKAPRSSEAGSKHHAPPTLPKATVQ